MSVVVQTNRTVDLDQPIRKTELPNIFVKGNDLAHQFNISLVKSGVDESIATGSCSALFINSAKQTIPVSGSVSTNIATVTLSEGCYYVTGRFLLIINVTAGGVTQSVFYGEGSISSGATDVAFDPDDIVPSFDDIIALFSTLSSYGEYNPEKPYVRYEHATHDGGTYMWNSDTPSVAGTDPTESEDWLCTAHQGEQGDPGASAYVHFKWAADEPEADEDMLDTVDEWIGIYAGTSATAPTAYTAYTWYQYKGNQGDPGVSAYMHIKWAAEEPDDDGDIGDTPNAWIGVYSGTSATAPAAYTAYTWYQWKGNTGATGTRGSRINLGDAITGTSTTPTAYATGIGDSIVGDIYMYDGTDDDDVGNVYQCTLGGDAATALWVYTHNVRGPAGTGDVNSVDSVTPTTGNVALSAVRYVAQSLSTEQKAQARSNIGAVDNTVASTSGAGLSPQASAPAAGLRNILGIDNGETAHSDKALFDATDPSTQAFGDSAAPGTAMAAARRDHKHAMPAAPTPASIGAATSAQGAKADNLYDFETINDASNVFAINANSRAFINAAMTVANTTAKTVTASDVPTRCSIYIEMTFSATAAITWTLNGGTVTWKTDGGDAPSPESGDILRAVFETTDSGSHWSAFAAPEA